MSKISLEGNASGTGTFTISAPNTNTNYTITLPEADGALVTSDQVSSNSLTQSIALASGTSVTAGRAVSLNASGEVGEYPVLNTLGTTRTNTTNTNPYYFTNSNNRFYSNDVPVTSFWGISTDGTRAIQGDYSQTGVYRTTATYTGVAITDSGNPVVGGTTQTIYADSGNTSGNSDPSNQSGAIAIPLTANTFLGVVSNQSYSSTGTIRFVSAVLTVDASGNVSKGTEVTVTHTNGANNNAYSFLYKISPTMVVLGAYFYVYGGTNTYFATVLSISGTTITATNQTTDLSNLFAWDVTGEKTITADNIVVGLSGTGYKTSTYSGGQLGTISSATTLISDLYSGASVFWRFLDSTRAVSVYKNTDNQLVLKTYSVTSATGAVAEVDSYVLQADATSPWTVSYIEPKSSTEFLISYINTFGYVLTVQLDASGNVNGTGLALANATNPQAIIPRYNGTDVFWLNYYQTNMKMVPVDANSYNTISFAFVGTSSSTTSSSPADITVGGVASGFSGLTPNSVYYVDNLGSGTLTTNSNVTGILVGRALTSSTILLGAS